MSRGELEVELSTVTIPFCKALADSTKIAAPVVLGTMCHPIYSIVNNIILGHGSDPTPLAGLGLGALTVGITGLSIGVCFAFGAGTFMAQEFGRKNMRMLEVYKNRSIVLNLIVFVILFIPSLFIG
jgi:Na+-driven multidrug efflux pump